jgi:hypothetical protein
MDVYLLIQVKLIFCILFLLIRKFLGRFIKDVADQNTLKIVDVQFDDGGSYVCRASTELDFDDASATLVVQDRPNRPRITKVNCSGSTQNSYGQPFAIVQWEATGLTNIFFFCFI